MSRVKAVVLVSAAVVCAGSVALAQGGARVLHEYFEAGDVVGAGGAKPGDQAPRKAVREPGTPPPLTLNAREDEPVLSSSGPTSALGMENPQGGLDPQNARNPLDDRTDEVDELNYFSSFDPSVIPYKRVVAQNIVETDGADSYAFSVEPGSYERVRVDGSPRPSHDEFWGTFLIKMEPGRLHPIPSVAASQRVMELRVVPEEAGERLRVLKDDADNFYVRSDYSGVVRMNMKVSAPRYYFTGAFDYVTWDEMRSVRARLSELPPKATRASEVARDSILGVQARMSPRETLTRLVEFFRGFENVALDGRSEGEDIYLALVREQRGVCRHRAFAFAITANAVGIPTRYVYNEAHAFVEVYWPGQGWRRIDLGGQASEVLMRAGQQQDHRVHSAIDHSLPKPPSYTEELEKLAQQEQDRVETAEQGEPGEDGPMSEDTGFSQDQVDLVDPEASQQIDMAREIEGKPPRRATSVTLSASTGAVTRGGKVTVAGRLRGAPGKDLTGAPTRVSLVLSSQGAKPGEGRLLGDAQVRADGRFEAEVEIPANLPIGLWKLRAVYAGSDEARESFSE